MWRPSRPLFFMAGARSGQGKEALKLAGSSWMTRTPVRTSFSQPVLQPGDP